MKANFDMFVDDQRRPETIIHEPAGLSELGNRMCLGRRSEALWPAGLLMVALCLPGCSVFEKVFSNPDDVRVGDYRILHDPRPDEQLPDPDLESDGVTPIPMLDLPFPSTKDGDDVDD